MNQADEDAWYYTREGERIGPVNFAELKIKASESALDPRLDMVWTAGMAEWKPAGEIEGLFERRTTEPRESLAPAADPYTPSKMESVADVMSREGGWPGARRRSFLFAIFVFPLLINFAVAMGSVIAAEQFGPEITGIIMLGAGIAPVLVAIYFSVQRLANLGMSRWWFFGNIVPLLNVWLFYRCFACPAGYAYHKKLDGPGIALAILFWLFFVIGLLVTVALIVLMFGMVNDPEMQKQLEEPLRILREKMAAS